MSATAPTAPAYRVEPGYVFPEEPIHLEASEQRRLHGHCGIPDDRYGGTCDVGLLARRPILLNTAAIQACRPGVAPVHTVQRIRQHMPVSLGETLSLRGEYVAVDEARRGYVARSRWQYRRGDGTVVLTVEPDVLLVDADRKPQKGSGSRRPDAAPAELQANWETLARKECTPDSTCGYCLNTTNLIHTDPDTARRFGFRAPIIAGNQTVNFVLEALALQARPRSFDIEVRFRKPVFWDEGIDIQGRHGPDGKLAEIRVVNDQGVVVADATVNAVEY